MTRKQTRYGWLPDLPDIRDQKLTAVNPTQDVPTEFTLDPRFMPPVRDQGDLGSCTTFAAGGAMEFLWAREIANGLRTVEQIVPSHLFLYYQERVLGKCVSEDAGAMIRDAMKVMRLWGVPDESLWPYDPARFADKPPQDAYEAGSKAVLTTYKSVDGSSMKQAIYGYGPVVFGISVYDSFESDAVAATGIVPMPTRDESNQGGHAVWAYGWKLINGVEHICCRNSWGAEWGDAGDFYLPFAYARNDDLAGDFWSMAVST